MPIALACAGLASGLLASPRAAHAQVAGALSLTSDYRVRGVSYSHRRPALTASLSDDLSSGVYFGASVIVDDPSESSLRVLGHQEYLGYARRLDNGVTWDMGLDNQRYEVYGPTPFHLSYSEAYVGLASGRFSTRLYYSPNYGAENRHIAYLEANAALRPAEGWRVAGHVGILQALNTWPFSSMKPRYDGRIDVIRRLGPAEVSVGVTGATPPVRPDRSRSEAAVIVGASLFF